VNGPVAVDAPFDLRNFAFSNVRAFRARGLSAPRYVGQLALSRTAKSLTAISRGRE
jgi:hypothetical protein